MLTKETIIHMLRTDKRAVARALVVLNDRQTSDEQASENTRYLNGRGFRPCHARMGTSMATQFKARGSLSDKQINYWRVPDRAGNMRIGIYWAQLLEEAKYKAQEKARLAALSPIRLKSDIAIDMAIKQGIPIIDIKMNSYPTGDLGNDMERKMVLEERLGDVLDSDDPAITGPIAAEINEIDAFWAKIRSK
jgi:hypothetical protein